MNRRHFLGGIAVAAMARPALSANAPQQIEIGSGEERIVLARYAARHEGRRPSVLLLHGSRGFELHLRAYERYTDALTSEGIDAYLARYYTATDAEKMKSFRSKEEREVYETAQYDSWSQRVSTAVAAVLKGDAGSDRIGLLGFSLGGFVAAATASRDSRVSALAVLYGGMPDKLVPEVRRMPAMIELHGDADRNVPFASGTSLVALAKATGPSAEQITYPGKPHGFDFADDDPATQDAVTRVAGFFRTHLGSGTPDEAKPNAPR